MTLNNFDYNLAQAYALGYYHGRAVGTENDPYVSDDLRFLYSEGYQRGVTDYCDLDTRSERK